MESSWREVAEKVRDLRTALGERKVGTRWPEEISTQVRRCVELAEEAGETRRAVAQATGLAEHSVQWICRAQVRKGGKVLAVEVRTPAAPAARLVLVTARGIRLEGLSVTQAAELLRALA